MKMLRCSLQTISAHVTIEKPAITRNRRVKDSVAIVKKDLNSKHNKFENCWK